MTGIARTQADKVEWQLQRALDSDTGPDELIDVVLRFDAVSNCGTQAVVPLVKRREIRSAEMSRTIAETLTRAEEITGTHPTHVTPFPMLGSAYVQAPRSYVRALVDQKEVAGAMLNKSPQTS